MMQWNNDNTVNLRHLYYVFPVFSCLANQLSYVPLTVCHSLSASVSAWVPTSCFRYDGPPLLPHAKWYTFPGAHRVTRVPSWDTHSSWLVQWLTTDPKKLPLVVHYYHASCQRGCHTPFSNQGAQSTAHESTYYLHHSLTNNMWLEEVEWFPFQSMPWSSSYIQWFLWTHISLQSLWLVESDEGTSCQSCLCVRYCKILMLWQCYKGKCDCSSLWFTLSPPKPSSESSAWFHLNVLVQLQLLCWSSWWMFGQKEDKNVAHVLGQSSNYLNCFQVPLTLTH